MADPKTFPLPELPDRWEWCWPSTKRAVVEHGIAIRWAAHKTGGARIEYHDDQLWDGTGLLEFVDPEEDVAGYHTAEVQAVDALLNAVKKHGKILFDAVWKQTSGVSLEYEDD